ncbi:hypothetical protein D3C72_1540990 [compost metagenome]
MAMVALAAHVVVELIDEAGRGGPHLQQDVSVGGTGPPRGVVLEEDVIGADPRHARQHGSVNRVDVVAPHRRELVLDAQAERIVALDVAALGGDPLLVIVAGREDAGHRFAQQVVIPRGQVPGRAGELGLAHHPGHRFPGRAHHRLQGAQAIDGAVDALGGDPDVGRDSDGVARVSLDEVDQAPGFLGGLAGEIHIPGLEVEIGIVGGRGKAGWQHMARQQGADQP